MINNTVANKLDIQKYLRTWYKIARYDHSFERGLVGVTANYSFRKDGKIKVLNSGYKNSSEGKFSQAIGKVKIPELINEIKSILFLSFFIAIIFF